MKSARGRHEVASEENKSMKAQMKTLEDECVELRDKLGDVELKLKKKCETIRKIEDEHAKEKEVITVVQTYIRLLNSKEPCIIRLSLHSEVENSFPQKRGR